MEIEDFLENSACRDIVDSFIHQFDTPKNAYRSMRDETVRLGSPEYY